MMHILQNPCSHEWNEYEAERRGKNQITKLNSSSMQFAETKTMKWQILQVKKSASRYDAEDSGDYGLILELISSLVS